MKRDKRSLVISESRELIATPTGENDFDLDKRGEKRKTGALAILYWIATYPPIGRLFVIPRAAQVSRTGYRVRKGYCAGSLLDLIKLTNLPTKEQYSGLETEHPMDKGLIGTFIDSSSTGILSSGRTATLTPISKAFWKDKWDTANSALAKKPPVGTASGKLKGKSPAKPSERVAEAFGSTYNPRPFLAVEKGMNIAKGSIFMLNDPVNLEKLDDLASDAVEDDTDEAADEMLSVLQNVSDIYLPISHLHRVCSEINQIG